MDTSELLAQVRRIQIVANRQVNDLLAGEYLSVFKGRGMEFDEVREYTPGDDVRSIDWNVTARTGFPHVKRYAEERELTILFVVDISRSGIFGSSNRAKLDLAIELTAVLMFSALKNNDKAGLVLFGNDIEAYFPPRKGKSNVLRLIRELIAAQPSTGGTNVASAMEFARRVSRRKAVIFLVSDLPEGDYEDELRIANRRHDVVAITVGDLRERSLLDDRGGPLQHMRFARLIDAETGQVVMRDLSSLRIGAAYAEDAGRRQDLRRRLLDRSGVDELAVDTARDYTTDLHRFFRMRERRINQGRLR